jgi:hypothetical protein
MKLLLIIAGIIIGLILLVYLSGYLLPVKHTASYSFNVNGSPDQVWQRITDIANYPAWRKDVKSVVITGESQWTEDNGNDKIPFKMTVNEPSNKLITEINSKNLPYGGHWVYELAPSENGTTVTLTENGEVYNPLFRVVSRFIMGHDTGIKQYAGYLQQSFK